ncbi:sugar-binding transcriptional regulator [Intestinibacter sp.]
MNNLLKMQQKLIPQVLDMMIKRYSILREIYLSETIGRRSLANVLGLSERIVRSETEVLREQGLINVETSGMNITEDGIKLLEGLKDTMNEVMGLSTLEEKLTQLLGIKKVILVPGDYEKSKNVLIDVGRTAATYFSHIIQDHDIVSITGGTTMAEFSKGLKNDKKFENIIIAPARGSVGVNIEIQSNNIVADISKKLHSQYALLNLPDKLGKESMMMLAQEPEIKRTLDLVSKSNVVVFGVGRADEMILRRNLSNEVEHEILDKGAVGESFGYYFNKSGEIVYRLNTIGIDLESVKQAREVIAVFAGAKKVEAFLAISKINKNLVLVTDEHSGKKLIELIKNQ